MPTSEKIAAAIETIDHLVAWLQDTGLSASAIAQFKFNSLASMYPELKGVAETAKQLIGAASPLTEVGMTVTELAAILTDNLECKIKPDLLISSPLMNQGDSNLPKQRKLFRELVG